MKTRQLFGNPGVTLPLLSSALCGNLPAKQFPCHVSALGGAAALPGASHEAGGGVVPGRTALHRADGIAGAGLPSPDSIGTEHTSAGKLFALWVLETRYPLG